jgi:hypothetical protein
MADFSVQRCSYDPDSQVFEHWSNEDAGQIEWPVEMVKKVGEGLMRREQSSALDSNRAVRVCVCVCVCVCLCVLADSDGVLRQQ